MKYFIDEDDLMLEWKEFKKIYPDVKKEEFELYQKAFQEVQYGYNI